MLELRRIWEEIGGQEEEEVKEWLDVVETEERLAELTDWLLERGEEHGIQR